jgi:hypothetical protein
MIDSQDLLLRLQERTVFSVHQVLDLLEGVLHNSPRISFSDVVHQGRRVENLVLTLAQCRERIWDITATATSAPRAPSPFHVAALAPWKKRDAPAVNTAD